MPRRLKYCLSRYLYSKMNEAQNSLGHKSRLYLHIIGLNLELCLPTSIRFSFRRRHLLCYSYKQGKLYFFALHLWKKCLDTHVENNLHWLSSHYTRDKHQGKEGTNVLIYCEEINKKSVSDPEYLLCASKIKLTKINVKKLHNHQSYSKPFRNQETITPTKLDTEH